jgi:hypothetical protein
MIESRLQLYTILAGLGVAVGVFVVLIFVSAPYGRDGDGFLLQRRQRFH